MTFVRIVIPLRFIVQHDRFGKPLPVFRIMR